MRYSEIISVSHTMYEIRRIFRNISYGSRLVQFPDCRVRRPPYNSRFVHLGLCEHLVVCRIKTPKKTGTLIAIRVPFMYTICCDGMSIFMCE